MTAHFEMLDYVGYNAKREKIDGIILGLLESGGKTSTEVGMALRAHGIGDAPSDNPLDLAYSKTGAIQRAAVNTLRISGQIYNSWDLKLEGQYERPFRYFHSRPPLLPQDRPAHTGREL